MQIRFRGVTNATYGTVFLLDDTSLAVTVPLRREGGEGAAGKAAAAGPQGALQGEGGGGTVAVAMDGKASAAMEVEAFESAEGEVLLPGREEGRAAEAAGTFVAWGGRPAFGSGPTSPGPNAREGDLEEAEGLGDPWGSFENEARVVSKGSEACKDEVEPDPEEATSSSAGPDTLEEWTTSAPAAFSNAVVRYYVTDHLGSPRVVLDAQRKVLDRHDYEPFGVELTPLTDQADLTHRFTGHERDLQTGYDYMHYRFYGSTLGRFLKPDSVVANAADPQSWNLYAYVRNNPILLNDPSGHLVGIAYRSYTWAGGDIAGSMGIHQEANALGGGIGLGSNPLDAGYAGPGFDSWFGLAGLLSSFRAGHNIAFSLPSRDDMESYLRRIGIPDDQVCSVLEELWALAKSAFSDNHEYLAAIVNMGDGQFHVVAQQSVEQNGVGRDEMRAFLHVIGVESGWGVMAFGHFHGPDGGSSVRMDGPSDKGGDADMLRYTQENWFHKTGIPAYLQFVGTPSNFYYFNYPGSPPFYRISW